MNSAIKALIEARADLVAGLYHARWNSRKAGPAFRALKAFDKAHPEVKAALHASVQS